MKRLLILLLITVSFYGCSGGDDDKTTERTSGTTTVTETPDIAYAVTKTFPHDKTLFTEGFVVHKGQLFESTGSPEGAGGPRSLIGPLDLTTGKMDEKIELDRSKYFGEGIVFLKGKLYQLTYKNQVGFIYDEKTFKQIGTFSYANPEGWALTTDGESLIMSDGTEKLTFINPADMKPFKTITVTQNGAPLERLNELEYINGFIYANVWMTNFIVKIEPASGKVVGMLNLGSLTYEAQRRNPDCDVLNGIAYDAAADKIYVTGKLWPNVYQIEFAH